jgi:glyoxylase-like metal-dependent hydrolase (beta-lactamase superfamily II)
MAEIKILLEGQMATDYPTITLIKDGNNKIIVDPGFLKEQKRLLDKLAEEGLIANDINIIFITHSHIDHYKNIGMFPKAKILEYHGIWNKNLVENWKKRFTKNIQIIKTPGHSYDGLTFLIKTKKGIIAVCGDIFWRKNFPKPKNDIYATDKEALKKSREIVLKSADWIIPGHAGMFSAK